jgi:hypothetical protein
MWCGENGWTERKMLDAYYNAIKDRYCIMCGVSCDLHECTCYSHH